MFCIDWPDTMPQTVAGESVTAMVVPEPKAWENGERWRIIKAVTVMRYVMTVEEGGFFIKENGNEWWGWVAVICASFAERMEN